MRRVGRLTRRSVDRGKCRLGIEPRNRLSSGCRPCRREGKATTDVPHWRGALVSREVRDPRHAQKQPAREPGDPAFTPAGTLGTHREVQGRTTMMNGRRKSDRPVVATKPANKAEPSVAELVERRGLAKGKTPRQNTNRALDREVVQSALGRIRQAAASNKKAKFTSLMHHIYNLSTLREAYYRLTRDAAPEVDGEPWRQYGENLESNLADLSARLRRGAYRAKPVRRVFITKEDGRQRPLGVTALEDKIVQRATVEVLNAIYETDFLGFSYGYRPGKGPHNALDALYAGLLTR